MDAGGQGGDLIADRGGRERRGGQDRLLQPAAAARVSRSCSVHDAAPSIRRTCWSPARSGPGRAAGTRPPGPRGSCRPASGSSPPPRPPGCRRFWVRWPARGRGPPPGACAGQRERRPGGAARARPGPGPGRSRRRAARPARHCRRSCRQPRRLVAGRGQLIKGGGADRHRRDRAAVRAGGEDLVGDDLPAVCSFRSGCRSPASGPGYRRARSCSARL